MAFVLLSLAVFLFGVPGRSRASGTLSLSSSSLNFGLVSVGSNRSLSVTLKNTGTSSLVLSSYAVQSDTAAYSVPGFRGSYTLAAGQSLAVTVEFAPPSVGSMSTSVRFYSNASDPTAQLSLTGTGVSATALSATPSNASFGAVPVGSTNTQTVSLKNSAAVSVTLKSYTTSGSGFTFPSIALPYTLAAGQALSLTVKFSPTVSGSFTGSMTVGTNVTGLSITIPASGSGGTATRYLQLNPTSVSFGNIVEGLTSTFDVKVTNTGNSNVTISAVSLSGTAFTYTGISPNLTIAPAQSAVLAVTFLPKTTGTFSGKISVSSNASDSVVSATLSGTGVVTSTHYAKLTWAASTSSGVIGYNVYRATSGGSYSKIASIITATGYTDDAVTGGVTYDYYVTAVSDTGAESNPSNQIAATIP